MREFLFMLLLLHSEDFAHALAALQTMCSASFVALREQGRDAQTTPSMAIHDIRRVGQSQDNEEDPHVVTLPHALKRRDHIAV